MASIEDPTAASSSQYGGQQKKTSGVLPWPSPLLESPTDVSVGQRGITYRQFQELARFTKRLCRTGLLRYTTEKRKNERVLWTEITMHEVCYNVIKPVLEHLGHYCAWSTLVNQGRPQKPKIFISHSWEECFPEFVATLEHLKLDRGLTATDVVWICTFANNQFELDLETRLTKSPFYGALEYSQQVALFLDHTASALSRSWCNFELAITTDTPQNRLRWKIRQDIADKQQRELFDVDWSEVDDIMNNRRTSTEKKAALEKEERQLLLCTPAGMVGTQRVTSGPVLKALSTLKSSQAVAFHGVDRRRIMNHIAYKYLVDVDNNNDNDMEQDKKRKAQEAFQDDQEEKEEDPERIGLQLENDPVVSDGKTIHSGYVPRRKLSLKPGDDDHEHRLTTGPKAKQFKMLDESIFIECSKALERRGLCPPRESFSRKQNDEESSRTLKRVASKEFSKQESGLALSQIRDLEVLLKSACEQSSDMLVDDKKLQWENCTSRHIFSTKTQSRGNLGKNHWKGLAAAFMPPDTTYAECVNEYPQLPEYYVIVPWGMELVEVFRAIEWHAEALGLSDRTNYFVHPFSLLSSIEENPGNSRSGGCEDIMTATTEGVVILVSEEVSKSWREVPERQSLWCFYELWLADQYGLPWDVACTTGISATSRPFANSKWECGTFNPKIAEHLAHMRVEAEDARSHFDRDMILSRIKSSPGGIAKFNESVTARLSIRMISPLMRHAAYMDDGMVSLTTLKEALRLLEQHRCKFFVNLLTFKGSFGETPLHIMAARHELVGDPAFADGHATMLALVHAGFGVNDQDDEGETPLHWAAFAGAEWTTACLLRHGANPMIRSYNGEQPLQIAQARPAEFLHKDTPLDLERILQSAMRPWQTKDVL